MKKMSNQELLERIEELESVIEEKNDLIQRLEEELDDFKRDVEDNYRPLTYAELVGISARDFY